MNNYHQQQQQQQQQPFNRTPDQSESWQAARPQPSNDPQPVVPSQPVATLSKEEIEFDEQFKKWELEFNNWKAANVNHPDKEAYRQYEKQFEGVRDKLLSVSRVIAVDGEIDYDLFFFSFSDAKR